MGHTALRPADVDSTFESASQPDCATSGFRGAHTCGKYVVRREYHPHIEAGTLEVRSEYYTDGTLVRTDTRRLVEDDPGSSRPDGSIAEFCRADHYRHVRRDIETAIEAADRYSRTNEDYPST